MSSKQEDDYETMPRETLIENLQIVKEHVPKIIDRLEQENEDLKQQLATKDAELAALKEQLAEGSKNE